MVPTLQKMYNQVIHQVNENWSMTVNARPPRNSRQLVTRNLCLRDPKGEFPPIAALGIHCIHIPFAEGNYLELPSLYPASQRLYGDRKGNVLYLTKGKYSLSTFQASASKDIKGASNSPAPTHSVFHLLSTTS